MYGAGAVIVVFGGLVALCIYDFKVNVPRERAEAAAKASVLLDGEARRVIVIEDRERGVRLRAIPYDRSLVILPGEQPLLPPVEAAK